MRRLLPALLLFGILSSPARAQSCTDARSLELQNASIALDKAGGSQRTDGLTSRREVVQLHGGVAYLSDDPGATRQRDWRVVLRENRLVHPDRATWLRVIVLQKDHLTGSGNWSYVMAFGCEKGAAVRLFWHRGEGLRLRLARGPLLELTEAVWRRGDAHCCPTGGKRRLIYRWSPASHRYLRLRHAAAR